MRTARITLFVFFAASSTSAVWAQYGLYGSPETLRMPQQEAIQAPAPPINYPSTATPTSQPAPAQAYYPVQPLYRQPAQPQAPAQAYYPVQPPYRQPAQPQAPAQAYYPAQPQYRYPAQPQAAAMYQPYQPGAQYRYPGPYARPPMRTAAVEPVAPIQPMPAPPMQPMTSGAVSPAPADAPMLQGSGMMNQMAAEQGCCDNGYGGVYRGSVGNFEQSACGPGSDGCGYDGYCGQGNYCPWYASVSALVLGRSDGRTYWTSYKQSDEKVQGGNTNFPMSWEWGGEVCVGHRFCCDCVPYALEATYWTTGAFTGDRCTAYAGDTVNTVLNVNFMTFSPGGHTQDASIWFMGAGEQTLARRDECQNIEINLVREQLAWACDSAWDIGWSAGVRYFRFQDSLVYDSVMPYHTTGDIYDASLSDDVTNNLIGVQFGFNAAYNLCNGLRLFIAPKVGIYDNYLDGTFRAQLGDGTVGRSTPYGTNYPVHGTSNGVAFLTQIDVGADYQFSRNWSARAGYRVLAVTGVGLAEDQFPQYICDVPQLQSVQNSSSLVLHGAFFGLTYNF